METHLSAPELIPLEAIKKLSLPCCSQIFTVLVFWRRILFPFEFSWFFLFGFTSAIFGGILTAVLLFLRFFSGTTNHFGCYYRGAWHLISVLISLVNGLNNNSLSFLSSPLISSVVFGVFYLYPNAGFLKTPPPTVPCDSRFGPFLPLSSPPPHFTVACAPILRFLPPPSPSMAKPPPSPLANGIAKTPFFSRQRKWIGFLSFSICSPPRSLSFFVSFFFLFVFFFFFFFV